jgi:phage terminase Nu1 subunit (DNA packaging protein)
METNMIVKSIQEILNEKQAADYLGVTARALQAWRYRGGGPRFIRISARCIRYRQDDLEQWLSERMANTTAEKTEAELKEEVDAR